MTELQKKEFELLKLFTDICEKIDVKYYLVCGSALGAVKYGGFIPWDDDVDVALFRDDYQRFLEEAPKLLPSNIFLQTYLTDSIYPNIYAKLRNSDTAYIESSSADLNINHGVYIDIFPLDGYPKNKLSANILEIRKKLCKLKQICVYKGDYSLKVRVIREFFRICGVHKRTADIAKRYERIISKYKTQDSEIICNHGNWQGKLEYAPRKQYGQGVLVSFEGIDVRVPELYDEYLTQKYGDWRAELPLDKQVGHHYYDIMDLNRSYTEFIANVSDDGRNIKLKKG